MNWFVGAACIFGMPAVFYAAADNVWPHWPARAVVAGIIGFGIGIWLVESADYFKTDDDK